MKLVKKIFSENFARYVHFKNTFVKLSHLEILLSQQIILLDTTLRYCYICHSDLVCSYFPLKENMSKKKTKHFLLRKRIKLYITVYTEHGGVTKIHRT